MMAPPAKKPVGGTAKGGSGKVSSKRKAPSLSRLYSTESGKIQRKNKFCPKCGPGYFMGAHANRIVCGKCTYTEYVKKA